MKCNCCDGLAAWRIFLPLNNEVRLMCDACFVIEDAVNGQYKSNWFPTRVPLQEFSMVTQLAPKFVVTEMGDDTNLPVTQGSTNYYISELQSFDDGDIGRIKLLAFLGCQMGARSFVYELADRATKNKMTRSEVLKECWDYINALHAASESFGKKRVVASKRPLPVDTHAEVAVESGRTLAEIAADQRAQQTSDDQHEAYTRRTRKASVKHDVADDVNEALGGQ